MTPQDEDKTDPQILSVQALGIIAPYLADPSITEILINGVQPIIVEKAGDLVETPTRVKDQRQLGQWVASMTAGTGQTLSPACPYLDLSLSDGSRVNIIGPPLTTDGICISIRKFPKIRYALDDLLKLDAIDPRISKFLRMCVLGRINILIAGGTSSGKTTLLNSLLALLTRSERAILIEDTPELAVPNNKSVRLKTRPETPGVAAIGARELVVNALRMRPDRLIVGECRTAVALEMLQAMNTGHEGSMTTIHANSARGAVSRLETLCMMSEVQLSLMAIRKQIVSAIDLIVFMRKDKTGVRRVFEICEITGMEKEVLTLQDIYLYDDRKDQFVATGMIPKCIEKLNDRLQPLGLNAGRELFIN